MAIYPDFKQHANSAAVLSDNISVDRSTGGRVRTRVLGDRARYSFSVQHVALTVEQRDQLLDFYQDNRGKRFEMIWQSDGKTYEVVFTSVLSISQIKLRGGVKHYNVVASMSEAL